MSSNRGSRARCCSAFTYAARPQLVGAKKQAKKQTSSRVTHNGAEVVTHTTRHALHEWGMLRARRGALRKAQKPSVRTALVK